MRRRAKGGEGGASPKRGKGTKKYAVGAPTSFIPPFR